MMQYRTDKISGNQLSCLGFGCMRFPKDKALTKKLIIRAVEAGMNYFDTAWIYPANEVTLGEILEKNNLRDKIYIATKLPQMLCKTKRSFDSFFNEELKHLRTDYIDYYLLHNLSSFERWQELDTLGIKAWIEDKKKEGKIKEIGFSFHGTQSDFIKIIDAYDWDFTQIQYNYINEHYQAGVEGLQYAASKGKSVIIMEPLMGGRLANVPKAALSLLQKARPGSSAAEWGLNWIWNQPEPSVVLSGMNSTEQLEENIRLAENAKPTMFSAEDAQAVKDAVGIVRKSYKIPCTGCNYCQPCTKGINIPACFAAYNVSYTEGLGTALQQYLNTSGLVQQSGRHYASDCISCGVCEKKCPQHIAIPEEMKKVKRRLEFGGLVKIIPFFVSRIAK
jgi:predicted aldo/keto reductase-like oxidoreductase